VSRQIHRTSDLPKSQLWRFSVAIQALAVKSGGMSQGGLQVTMITAAAPFIPRGNIRSHVVVSPFFCLRIGQAWE
jgi:hypothetical protein